MARQARRAGRRAAARCAQRRVRRGRAAEADRARGHAGALRRRRSTTPSPTPPFWGDRVVKGIALADVRRATSTSAPCSSGQWGLKPARGGDGPTYEELVETEGRPRLRDWLDRVQTEGLIEAAVVYGYFPCVSEGDDLVVLARRRRHRADALHVPAPAPRPAPLPRRLLPARGSPGEIDVVGFQLATVGARIAEATAELFARQRLPRLPRAARPVGAAGRGARRVLARARPRRSSASPARTHRDLQELLASAIAARASPSATAPAPTWRTAPRSSSCSSRSASASSSRRSSSCIPSSRPTRSSCHHPEAKYFNA